jgi:hypothetical protein
MKINRRLTILVIVALSIVSIAQAHIGYTLAECDEHYGPLQKMTPDGRRVYEKSGFEITVYLKEGLVESITYVKKVSDDEQELKDSYKAIGLDEKAANETSKKNLKLTNQQVNLLLKSNYSKSEWHDPVLEKYCKNPDWDSKEGVELMKTERDFKTTDGSLSARFYPDFNKLLISKSKIFSKIELIEARINLEEAKCKANIRGL